MSSDGEFNQAFQSFSRRENLPADLTSEEWSSVPSEIRERAFFMSKVTDTEILQRFRDGVEDVVANRKGLVTVEKELFMWLQERGYEPPPGKEGTLQDLSSLPRIMVVLRTNRDMARGHGKWVRNQTSIRSHPVREFIRISARKEPRDWDARWEEAKASTADVPGVHPTEKIALVNHPIWAALSRFNLPYAPYDFGSGMGDQVLSRSRAKELGFDLDPNNDPMQKPLFRSINEGLELKPEIHDEVLKETLSERLGRFGKWDGEKLIFADPNGTKKYTAAELKGVWDKPAPENHAALPQKEALDRWQEGTKPDPVDDRVRLRRLFERLITEDQPAELFRAFELTPADAVALIRGLSAKRITIPGNVAGWSWTDKLRDAEKMIARDAKGWRVVVDVQGASKAIDISALRPGKPGFVYLGGTEFKVEAFTQDVVSRRISITLSEG